MSEMDWVRFAVIFAFGLFQYWLGYRSGTRLNRNNEREHVSAYRKMIRDAKAEAWDEGFNAGEGEAYEHEARLQWSMPHTCAKNPYREETK